MSKILVTGGAGFIGSNFIRYWLKNNENDHIINLDKLTYAGNLDSLSDVIINPNYKFVQGDICNTDLVNDLTVGVDLIINFAAESHVDRSILSSADFIKTNEVPGMVVIDTEKKTTGKMFKIRSYPSALLLNSSMEVILSPARTPLDGFENQFKSVRKP